MKSLAERVRHRFDVAVAEVDEHEIWNEAVLGIACVSTASAHARNVLDHVARFVETGHDDAELVDHTIEILTGF